MSQYDVLIVDDEQGICQVVSGFTKLAGFTYETAENGEKAFELLSSGNLPSLIICDISMPRMNGLKLLEKIRERGWPCSVVMLTAHTEGEKIIEALRMGAIDYISKPFHHKKLVRNLTNWVEIGRSFQALYSTSVDQAEFIAKRLRIIELYRIKSKAVADSAA